METTAQKVKKLSEDTIAKTIGSSLVVLGLVFLLCLCSCCALFFYLVSAVF